MFYNALHKQLWRHHQIVILSQYDSTCIGDDHIFIVIHWLIISIKTCMNCRDELLVSPLVCYFVFIIKTPWLIVTEMRSPITPDWWRNSQVKTNLLAFFSTMQYCGNLGFWHKDLQLYFLLFQMRLPERDKLELHWTTILKYMWLIKTKLLATSWCAVGLLRWHTLRIL